MSPWTLFIGLLLIALGVGAIFGINVWQYFFPLLLIIIGLGILFRGPSRHSWRPSSSSPNPTTSHENTLDYSLSFTGIDIKVETNNFLGGKVSTLFAGANIDLRSSKITKKEPLNLELSTVFGGVKVMVPKSWKVEGNMSGVFGGFTNATTTPDKPEGILKIKGSAVFGGGEITN